MTGSAFRGDWDNYIMAGHIYTAALFSKQIYKDREYLLVTSELQMLQYRITGTLLYRKFLIKSATGWMVFSRSD
jgi:hypothetical protein